MLNWTETEFLFDYLYCGCRCISVCGSVVYISSYVTVVVRCCSGAREGKRFWTAKMFEFVSSAFWWKGRTNVERADLFSEHNTANISSRISLSVKHLSSKVLGSAPLQWILISHLRWALAFWWCDTLKQRPYGLMRKTHSWALIPGLSGEAAQTSEMLAVWLLWVISNFETNE